jgi:metallopeptidase MepB
MARNDNENALETKLIGFHAAVSPDRELRDASVAAVRKLADYAVEALMREDLFQLVDAVLKRGEPLDSESQRLLEKEHRSYVQNGLGIPAGPRRDRFKEIKRRLNELVTSFHKTLTEEQGGIWFSPQELDGVPTDIVSNLAKGTGENDGKLWLTFKYPHLFPTLRYATSSSTRKKLFVENENKCNANAARAKEVIVLRDEAARLLGYENHAQLRLEDRLLKTPENVNSFLNGLVKKLAPQGSKEIEMLLKLKKADLESRGRGSEYDGRYYLWDHYFYDRLMTERNYNVDQNKIAEYFPLETTTRNMLSIFERLFGLVFVELKGKDRDAVSDTGKGEDIVWHEDVSIFSVWNDESEGSGFLGYLYLDLFPRGGKFGHAAMFNLQPVSLSKPHYIPGRAAN